MKELHDCYCAYCLSIGVRPLGSTGFGRVLTKRHFLSCKIGQVRARYGIALKQDAMPPPAVSTEQPVWFGTSSELLTIIRKTERGEPCPEATPELLRILKEVL